MQSIGKCLGMAGACTLLSMVAVFSIFMLVNGDGIELNADNSKRSCAAWQEFVVCASGELLCILIFGRDKRRSIKKDIFTQFLNCIFAYTGFIMLFITLFRLSLKSGLFSLANCGWGLLIVHGRLARAFSYGRRIEPRQ